MASPCPINASAFLSAAGACVCHVGQYLVDGACQSYMAGPNQVPETSLAEFFPPLPTAASWTSDHAQLISIQVTSILVGVWMLFCLGLRLAPLEGRWFRLRYKLSRADFLFLKQHWYDEQKCQVKRRTELGGAMSLACLLFFTGLVVGIIWDLETQKQYTVESVVIASNREVQHFENDLDFNLTGYGSLRCEMLTQPTVTAGQVTEEARTLPAIATGDSYFCANNPDGVTIRLLCPNCTAARENYLIDSEFLDLNGTQAYAVGWAYSVCAVDKSRNYKSCVSGSIAGASNGTYAPVATMRGPLPNVLSFRFFPRSFQQFDPELWLLESTFRQYTAGSFATSEAELQPLFANTTGVRVAMLLEIATSFIVITKSQTTNGWLVFLAKLGGLYTFSYWMFYFILMQCEKRIKRLRYDDRVINSKERNRIARKRWEKVRMFVKFSRFDTRKARRNPNQVVLNVVDDAEAPPVVPKSCPRVTSGGQSPAAGAEAFSESRETPLSGVADMRNDKERIKDNAERGSLIDISLSSLRPMPAFWEQGTGVDGGATGARVLKRAASLPGGSVNRFRTAAPLPDFSLTQHIPRDLQTQDRRRTSTDRPNDYLLESQHSAPKEGLGGLEEEPGVPARLRGGAPSPPATPPHLDEFGISAESPSPRGGQPWPPKSPPVTSRVVSSHEETSPRFNGFESLYNVDRGVQIPLGETPPFSGQPQLRGRQSAAPSLEDSPHSKRIHVSPPPRTLTPPLPPTPGSSRPPQSPTGAADVSNGNRSKKRPKPIDVTRTDSEVSLARSEPGSVSTNPSERGHHRRGSSAGSGVALLTNIGRGLSRVIPGSMQHLHIPGLGHTDGQKPSEEEAHERLMQKKRKKLGYRTAGQQTGMVVRRLRRPSWLGHNVPLPAVPKAPEEEEDVNAPEEAEPDIFAMYNHLQDLYDYNVRLREDFLLAQSMLENVVQRFRPHGDL